MISDSTCPTYRNIQFYIPWGNHKTFVLYSTLLKFYRPSLFHFIHKVFQSSKVVQSSKIKRSKNINIYRSWQKKLSMCEIRNKIKCAVIENNPWWGGMILAEADYFSVTAYGEEFYSSYTTAIFINTKNVEQNVIYFRSLF